MIECFQETALGDLLVANGVDAMRRWDGHAHAMGPVGMAAPTQAVNVSQGGNGTLAGTYYAYLRFIDAQGNPSNLSPISNEFVARSRTGTITGVTATTPVVITATAHGLMTGDTVKVSGVGGITEANGLWVITVLTANTFSLDESTSSGFTSYTGGGTWGLGCGQINYTSVQTTQQQKVVRRQILRNTDGQATTFYVDVDTTDLTGNIFSSTLTDAQLAAREAVPLLDSQGAVFANRHDQPLDYFKFLVSHLGYVFAFGTLEYNIGSVEVTFGSATVQGDGTAWKSTLAGRFFYVVGADKVYEIASVSEANQTLTLTETYIGETNLFAFYSIKPPAAYRRIVQFTAPNLPQSWPLANGLEIEDTGDEFTGGFRRGPYLFFVESRHIHKLTFSVSPLIDGAVFMVANRGCINNRSWVLVDGVAYMLDELGVHRFSGNSQIESLSDGINSILATNPSTTRSQVSWEWKEFFHAHLDRERKTIRWFVCLDGNRYPRHALCLHYPSGRWWTEEYPLGIGGAASGTIDGNSGRPQSFYGGQHAKILAAWDGTTDLVNPRAGTVRSTATNSGAFFLADTAASFASSGLVNAPLAITAGKGAGQVRRVVAVSGATLTIDRPWAILPDTTSVYQLGGVQWRYRSSWMRLSGKEELARRRFEVLFQPLGSAASASLRFYHDFSQTPETQAVTQASAAGAGLATTAGLADLIMDLTKRDGLIQRELPHSKPKFVEGRHYTQVEMEGWSNVDLIRFYQLMIEGVIPGAGIGGE